MTTRCFKCYLCNVEVREKKWADSFTMSLTLLSKEGHQNIQNYSNHVTIEDKGQKHVGCCYKFIADTIVQYFILLHTLNQISCKLKLLIKVTKVKWSKYNNTSKNIQRDTGDIKVNKTDTPLFLWSLEGKATKFCVYLHMWKTVGLAD